MFSYDKFLQFPINIKKPNPRLANIIITQYGGAYCKYLSSTVLMSPKHAFKPFSAISAFYNFFKNCPCHVVFFNITQQIDIFLSYSTICNIFNQNPTNMDI